VLVEWSNEPVGNFEMPGAVIPRSGQADIVRGSPQRPNARTARQRANRGRWKQLKQRWHDVLTPQQQSDWATFAANSSYTLLSGRETFLTGYAAFMKATLTADRAGIALPTDAPASFGYSPTNIIEVSQDPDAGQVTVVYDDTDDWTEDGGALIGTAFSPTSPGRTGARLRSQHLFTVLGNSSSPPPGSITITFPWPMPIPGGITIKVCSLAAFGIPGLCIPLPVPIPSPDPGVPDNCDDAQPLANAYDYEVTVFDEFKCDELVCTGTVTGSGSFCRWDDFPLTLCINAISVWLDGAAGKWRAHVQIGAGLGRYEKTTGATPIGSYTNSEPPCEKFVLPGFGTLEIS